MNDGENNKSDGYVGIGEVSLNEVYIHLSEEVKASTKSLNQTVTNATSAIDSKMKALSEPLLDLQAKNQSVQKHMRALDEKTEEIKQDVDSIALNIEQINSALSKFDYAQESSHKGTFLTFTVFFALITLLCGIFTAKGYILGFENLDLLMASLAFVLISALGMGLFHLFYAIFDLHDDDEARLAFYAVMTILNSVSFVLSLIVLCG